MDTTNLCTNCEFAVATLKCVNCPDSVSLFCKECSTIHTKVKQSRTHTFTNYKANVTKRICCNCDSEVSRYVCSNCSENDKFLCVGCSIIHPKVKTFRGHIVSPINNTQEQETIISWSNLTRKSISETFGEVLEIVLIRLDNLNEDILHGSYSDSNYWKAILIIFSILSLFLGIMRFLFGRRSVFVSFAAAGLIFVWSRSQQAKRKQPIKKMSVDYSNSQKSNGKDDSKGFESEFWYPLQGNPAHFKPRSRVYKRRGKAKDEQIN